MKLKLITLGLFTLTMVLVFFTPTTQDLWIEVIILLGVMISSFFTGWNLVTIFTDKKENK